MRNYIRTRQSLYERPFAVALSAANTRAFLSHCAASGDTGSEKRVLLQSRLVAQGVA